MSSTATRSLVRLIAATLLGAACSPKDAGATTFTRVTSDSTRESDPAPSPDGKWLAYTSDRSGSQQVWVMPIGGGPARQLTFEPESLVIKDPERPDTTRTIYVRASGPTWAPDSKSILYISTRTGRYNIYRLPLTGGEPQVVSSAPGNHRFAVYSPDGSKIAFYSNRLQPGSLFGFNIYVMDSAGETPERLARQVTNSNGSPGHPTWSPDGKWIAYVAKVIDTTKTVSMGAGITMKQNAFTAKYRTWKVPVTGGREIQVSPESVQGMDFEDTWPTWSPADPRWIAIGRTLFPQASSGGKAEPPKRDVWVVDATTRAGFPITTTGNSGKPTWTWDGKAIYYTTFEGMNEDIWVATDLTLKAPAAKPARSAGAKRPTGGTRKTTPGAAKGTAGK